MPDSNLRMLVVRRLWIVGLALVLGARLEAAEELGVKVPDGFEVVEFAGDDLAHDIYSMTIDSQGRVVVAGAGYVKILIDKNGDGTADEAKLFSNLPKNGAQGMYFLGRNLICLGDGGLLRFRDADGDDRADGPPDVFLRTKTGGEHDVHSIQLGPDGWWYVIAGNNAGIDERYITLPQSPIKQPRAGVLFRLKPDLSAAEVLAHGLRNAYDFAFNPQGDLFTYDSDEEREVSLPWYRPTRVFQVLPGADHGWVSKSWMRPDVTFDMPPLIASFGRGSPTGVVCYRHTQFPQKYRGALLGLDWSYGRVHVLPLQGAGETWKTIPELFMSAVGQHGFAPTDADVGPDGSLYVSVGGRGTRGAVYRIRYTGKADAEEKTSPKTLLTEGPELEAVLKAPQPLSSWSRAQWLPTAKTLGASAFQMAALTETGAVSDRIRAIEVLTELFGGVDEQSVSVLAKSSSPEVRARAIWSYGRIAREKYDAQILKLYLDDPHPLVRRAALETCLCVAPNAVDWLKLLGSLARNLGCAERYNRGLASQVVSRLDESLLPIISSDATKVGGRAVVSYAFGWLNRPKLDAARIQGIVPGLAVSVLKNKNYDTEMKRDAVRLLQIALGDFGPATGHLPTFDGYASRIDLEPYERDLDPLRTDLSALYPTGDIPLDRELLRLLAMLTSFNGKLVGAITDQMTDETDPIDDIHHLAALSRLPMTHTVKQRDAIVKTLVQLDAKVGKRGLHQDASWNDRIKDIWVTLALADDYLAAAIVSHPSFGQPGHTVFLNQMAPELLPIARSAFARQISANADYAWTNEVVFALGDSTEPAHRILLRSQFDRFSVRGAVLVILSRDPEPIDRERFVAGLEWSQSEVQAACLSALEKLGPSDSPAEQLALLKSLRRLGSDEQEYVLRETVARLLERNTNQKIPFVTGKEGHKPQPAAVAAWTAWCQKKWPQEAAAELGDSSGEQARLQTLLKDVDWTSGNVVRGAQLYARRACVQCHSASGALGPDLAGAANRFSREDLFTAIAIPSRDVSARYQTTIVQTKDGKTYSGLVIYESVDGFILRNGTGQTFRIETPQVDEKRKSPISLMPTGLLKDLTLQDYADLYAYLQSLAGGVTATTRTD
ncbi:MAG: c-type cytochrome [Planctomycetes bacterium]|nr:c-type cytochrome [Planctomycetota bacterium]